MGLGDDVMLTGTVRQAALKHPGKKIAVGDGTQIIWSEVFENNPYLTREIVPGCVWVHNSPGRRPYIKKIHEWGYEYNEEYRAVPGDLYIGKPSDEGFVYIEPNVKGTVTQNKDWGFDNWQRVVNRLPGVRFVQGAGRRLDGVTQFDTKSFLDACRILLRASVFVGTDGALHHAAAALGKRAVVVWGGFSHPRIVGYDSHINLHSGVKPCGRFEKCEHCTEALKSISVTQVMDGIDRALRPVADARQLQFH